MPVFVAILAWGVWQSPNASFSALEPWWAMKKTLIAALGVVSCFSAVPAHASREYVGSWQAPDHRGDYHRGHSYGGQDYGRLEYAGREYRDDRREYRDDRRDYRDDRRDDRGRGDPDFRDGRLLMECSGIMSRFGQYNQLFSEREEDRMDRMQARFAEESGRLAPRATRRERERWFADGVRRADQITRRSSQRGLVIEDLLRDNLRVEMRRCRDIYRG